jgi:predicted enzyme involved in methoxymalonyl-ACP biosynthesis
MGPPTCPITPNIGLRATLYVDDLVNSIEFALRSVELEHVDKFVVDTVLMLGVRFGLEGSVEVALSDEDQKKAQDVAMR